MVGIGDLPFESVIALTKLASTSVLPYDWRKSVLLNLKYATVILAVI